MVVNTIKTKVKFPVDAWNNFVEQQIQYDNALKTFNKEIEAFICASVPADIQNEHEIYFVIRYVKYSICLYGIYRKSLVFIDEKIEYISEYDYMLKFTCQDNNKVIEIVIEN